MSRWRTARMALCIGVLTPLPDIPVFVDMGCFPRLIGREFARIDRQRQQRRAGERGHHVQRGKTERVFCGH